MLINSIQNKTVLVRVGFDVADLEHVDRIKSCLATIKLLVDNNNKVVLISKWGRPKNADENFSLRNLKYLIQNLLLDRVSEKCHLTFLNQFESWEEVSKFIKNNAENNNIFLLENIYFNKDEFSTDQYVREALASKYASLANVFVDECFISSHRLEATNAEIKKLLPHALGLNYLSEIDNLEYFVQKPAKPFILLLGGAKLDTKIPLLNNLLPKVDQVILGGIICFPFLKVLHPEYEISVNPEELDLAKAMLKKYSDKIILAKDFVPSITSAKDVGPESIKYFKELLGQAGSVFWNGPLGVYEDPQFATGTLEIANFLSEQHNIHKVIGGGDTGAAIPENILKKFNFVSQGGGATLEFLSKFYLNLQLTR